VEEVSTSISEETPARHRDPRPGKARFFDADGEEFSTSAAEEIIPQQPE